MRRNAAIHRSDHRLNNRDRPVIRPRIRPALQIVRLIDVPVRNRARLIHMRTQVHRHRNLRERILEVQIARRRINRIHAQNHQPLHLARVHIGDQRLQIRHLLARHRIHRLGIDDRLANRTQRRVQRISRSMNRRRSLLTRNHHTPAAALLQIRTQRRKELLRLRTRTRGAAPFASAVANPAISLGFNANR